MFEIACFVFTQDSHLQYSWKTDIHKTLLIANSSWLTSFPGLSVHAIMQWNNVWYKKVSHFVSCDLAYYMRIWKSDREIQNYNI